VQVTEVPEPAVTVQAVPPRDTVEAPEPRLEPVMVRLEPEAATLVTMGEEVAR
jgi:hypothetical protein